jgi:hypothetical protein
MFEGPPTKAHVFLGLHNCNWPPLGALGEAAHTMVKSENL